MCLLSFSDYLIHQIHVEAFEWSCRLAGRSDGKGPIFVQVGLVVLILLLLDSGIFTHNFFDRLTEIYLLLVQQQFACFVLNSKVYEISAHRHDVNGWLHFNRRAWRCQRFRLELGRRRHVTIRQRLRAILLKQHLDVEILVFLLFGCHVHDLRREHLLLEDVSQRLVRELLTILFFHKVGDAALIFE